MKDTELLGKKIRQLRLSNDLSLRDLAELSNISFSFISSIEKNRYNASRETILALADVLKGADKNELLLLAGFAPEDNQQDKSKSSYGGRAFLGGADKYSEEELELAEAAAKAAIDAFRKMQKKKGN